MAPPNRRRPPTKAADQRARQGRGRPKVCMFCTDHAAWVDYKDTNLLRRFISDRGKIRSRGNTGACAQHQREVAIAVKTARELALLPYAVRTLAADKPGGRGRGGRGGRGARPDEAAAEAEDVAAVGEEDEGAEGPADAADEA
jgi:small subunit ribosomal protein S18